MHLVNAYFGILTEMRYFQVNHHIASYTLTNQSQLWHRDPDNRVIIKMFVYLTDVNAGCGPFCFAPCPHL